MRRAVRAIDRLSRIFGAIAAALVIVLIALMAYEVALRYVFKAPTLWSYDVSTMTMGATFVLAIGYTLATNAHVRVDILKPLLGRRGPHVVDFAGYALVMLPLLLWLTWAFWGYFHDAWVSQERSGQSAWNPKVWPFRLVMLAGVVVWTLQTLAEAAKAGLALAGHPLEARHPAETRAPGEAG
jgi:TRAP-type mannitol/chloroaromatic compound transport system permease small subunit